MRSIKAITAGCVFIVVVMLLMQLIFIFVAVGYNALSQTFPVLNDITGVFRYVIGIPLFVGVMFAGGYITASVSSVDHKMDVWLHCLAVGLITAGGMIFSAMENANLTMTGIVVFILAITAATSGGMYWQNGNKLQNYLVW